MKKRLRMFLAVSVFLFAAWTADAATYNIDQDHSSVGFKIRHLVSKVSGNFNEFSGVIQYEPGQPESWKADAVIKTASIDTNSKQRDEHLRKPDFFDAEKFPEITFKSTGVRDATETTAKVDGLLSMHGVEKPVTLDLEIHGIGKSPWGSTSAGFTATVKINRKDFGIIWNKTVDATNLMLGDEVEIVLEIEATQASA